MSSNPAPMGQAPGPDRLVLIAAITRNRGIGLQGRLLVHLPEDLKHFRRATLGAPVIMGRLTWDSLPAAFRPLPGRLNIVLTREAGARFEGAETATSLPQALQRLQGIPRAFVIGGEQIYRLALPHADELLLTEIEAEPPADAFFPAWDPSEFRETARVPGQAAPDGMVPDYSFATYERIAPSHASRPSTITP